ncbi:rod-determining factor RdfA [Salinibaculum marinum]
MEPLSDELERRWVGEDGQDASVRELTQFFNQRVLESALGETGVIPLEGELENTYRLLSEDDSSETIALQVKERFGLSDGEIQAVKKDFVSHQTMYRYLTNVREITKASTDSSLSDQIQSVKRTAQKIQSRLTTVVTDNLESLSKKEGFYVGDFDVTVSVTVTCRQCNTSRSLLSILDDNGCECKSE